jgi:hypothetical protein
MNVAYSTGEFLLNFTSPYAISKVVADIIDQGACRSDGASPLASIDWVAYDNGRYFLTTSNITLGNRTYSMHMPPAIVEDWTSEEYDLSTNFVTRYYSIGDGEGTINSEELRDQTLCLTTKVYEWGFSSLLLFIFGIVTTISGAILLVLNAVVWRQTGTKTLSVDFSIWRDILDLAGEIKAELGDDAEDLTAATLNDRIKTDTGNVRIVTKDLSLPSIASEGWRYS